MRAVKTLGLLSPVLRRLVPLSPRGDSVCDESSASSLGLFAQ